MRGRVIKSDLSTIMFRNLELRQQVGNRRIEFQPAGKCGVREQRCGKSLRHRSDFIDRVNVRRMAVIEPAKGKDFALIRRHDTKD